jgi:hypothetical protein
VRLTDFIVLLLEAHAHTLQRIAALLGEDTLIEILELTGERQAELEEERIKKLPLKQMVKPNPRKYLQSSAYGEIEHAVQQLKLSPMLEFHLWSYPAYRELIESPLDLESIIDTEGDAINQFTEHAVEQARNWMHELHLPPDISKRAEAAASVPWTRFRMTVLTKSGKKPFLTVPSNSNR